METRRQRSRYFSIASLTFIILIVTATYFASTEKMGSHYADLSQQCIAGHGEGEMLMVKQATYEQWTGDMG